MSLEEALVKYNLNLIKTWKGGLWTEYVALVEELGGLKVLKKVTPNKTEDRGFEGLLVWQGAEWVVEVERVLEDQTFLMEYIEGEALSQLPDQGASEATELGRLIAKAPSAPLEIPSALGWYYRRHRAYTEDNQLLSPELSLLAKECYLKIAGSEGNYNQLLHGDLLACNVIKTSEGLRFIDPYSLRGHPALDIVRFAAFCQGEDPLALVEQILIGYASYPEGFQERLIFIFINHYGAALLKAMNPPVSEERLKSFEEELQNLISKTQ